MILPPINPNCFVCIVIPVKNEAQNIGFTLDAAADQVDLDGNPLDKDSFEVIVFANNCTDNSVEIIKKKQDENSFVLHLIEENLPPENANIGFVRRRLMNEAESRLLKNHRRRGVIMTTDGDTHPAPNWIAANLKEIEAGADAVGGRILIKKEDLRLMDENARRFHLIDTGYRLAAAEIEARLDPQAYDFVPRHHQHFNGSFAVTVAAFQQAGRIPDVRFLEDIAFYNALLRKDLRVRHSPEVRVYTSSRAAGRVECGLSTQISDWMELGKSGDKFMVESPAALIARISCRRRLREVWSKQKISEKEFILLAGDLLIEPDFLKQQLEEKQTFGLLLEKIYAAQHENEKWSGKYPQTCVSRALADLRLILESFRKNNQNLSAFRQTSSL